MLLLHVSDFHFGPKSRFAHLTPAEFAKRFATDLKRQLGELKIKGGVDVVVATGDFAESGTRTEFVLAGQFLRALAHELGLPAVRFVLLPGNHDISWAACRSVENEQEELGLSDAERDERLHKRKLEQYERMVAEFYSPSTLSDLARPLEGGGRLYNFVDLGLSVAALNSCEKETHRPGERFGFLSVTQSQNVLEAWKTAPDGFRVLALHHPPVPVVPANVGWWRTKIEGKGVSADQVDRLIADLNGIQGSDALRNLAQQAGAQLVLHGHQHAGDTNHWAEGLCHVLSAGSLCLVNGELPEDEPLGYKLVELVRGRNKAKIWSFVYAPRDPSPDRVLRGTFRLDSAEKQPRDLHIQAPKPKAKDRKSRPALAPDQEHFLKVYRKAFESDFDRWDLSASGVTTADHFRKSPAALDSMYLPLRLAEGRNPRELDKGEILGSEGLLVRGRSLLIRGQAGAGKTTWVRHTFRRLVRDPAAFPLLLVLRDLSLVWGPEVQGQDRSLVAYLENKIAQRLGGLLPTSQLKVGPLLAAEAGPRPILLVDGWDEIGPLGEDIRTKLQALQRLHPRLLVVVTSRPYDVGGRPNHSDGFDELDVQSLSDVEIRRLTTYFFRHLHGADEARALSEVELFEKALARSVEARELGRTPLLLTMMLGIHSAEPLPDKRHRLYEACIRNLLSKLPERKAEEGARVGEDQWCPDIDERLRVVARLAFDLQYRDYRRSRRATIVATKSELRQLLPGDGEWREKQELFLNWLMGTAGILTEYADRSLAFSHLSFQEYLAAYHLKVSLAGKHRLLDLVTDAAWWETLLLWVALVGAENAKRARNMIAVLLGENEPRPRLLAGMMLADGLGTVEQLAEWAVSLPRHLAEDGLGEGDRVAAAFAASRQEGRRAALLSALDKEAARAGWMSWARLDRFAALVRPGRGVAQPPGLLVVALVAQLTGKVQESSIGAALARSLAGAHPFWPFAPAQWPLLQVWPARRRILGARIQTWLAAGAGEENLNRLAAAFTATKSNAAEGRQLARYFVRDFARIFPRNLARDLARDVARDVARDFAREFVRELAHHFIRDFACSFELDLSRDLSGDFGRKLAHFIGRDLVRDFGCGFARSAAGDFARALDLPLTPEPIDALRFELSALGRSAARALLAAAKDHPDDSRWRLLQAACRLSLNPGSPSVAFEQALATEAINCGEDLWPALARHLARRALPGDRELLEEAVRHPETRPEPLRSGLQFIARGDVIFDDGSVKTLEEICEGLDVDLPLLEDMPDEIDLGPDWDKDLP